MTPDTPVVREALPAGLPGAYAPPGGLLLVAARGAGLVGTIAYRRVDEGTCEMKRLFISPEARGLGLGRALITRAIADARAAGYGRMRLDTLPVMREAQAMYEAFGFRDIPPYYASPIPGTRFMARAL